MTNYNQPKATENNFATPAPQSDETRLTGELDNILLPYFGGWKNEGDTFYFATNANEVERNKLKKQILDWHETEKQKYAMAYADEIIGRNSATHHNHPFLSDHSMSKINITINDMILYDKSQHFTKETKEWFENTINKAIDSQLQQKCNNEIRKKQREINKSKVGKI